MSKIRNYEFFLYTYFLYINESSILGECHANNDKMFTLMLIIW